MSNMSAITCTLFLSLSLTLVVVMNSIAPGEAALTKTQMIKQMLEGHNSARKEVGVPPLKWDPKLAAYARLYANQRRKDCKLIHSPGYGYGECLFWGQGRKWSASDAVKAWVAEKKVYKYNTNSCSGKQCGHYTQIVWRTTKRVGCAKVICGKGDSYIACEYHPPGNYIGARPY